MPIDFLKLCLEVKKITNSRPKYIKNYKKPRNLSHHHWEINYYLPYYQSRRCQRGMSPEFTSLSDLDFKIGEVKWNLRGNSHFFFDTNISTDKKMSTSRLENGKSLDISKNMSH